jgi:ABC-type oligopeptide transport system substrate-binding subunit
MNAGDRNCKLGAMRSMTAIATLTAVLLAAPAQANGPKSVSTSAVEAMNRHGFAEFASFDGLAA